MPAVIVCACIGLGPGPAAAREPVDPGPAWTLHVYSDRSVALGYEAGPNLELLLGLEYSHQRVTDLLASLADTRVLAGLGLRRVLLRREEVTLGVVVSAGGSWRWGELAPLTARGLVLRAGPLAEAALTPRLALTGAWLLEVSRHQVEGQDTFATAISTQGRLGLRYRF